MFKEPLNKWSAAEQRAFCLIRAVLKLENTQSIPAISVLSAGPKSLAVSSCPFNQSFLKNINLSRYHVIETISFGFIQEV